MTEKTPAVKKNATAVALGKLNKGIPRNFTPEEREKRAATLAIAREKRWPSKKVSSSKS